MAHHQGSRHQGAMKQPQRASIEPFPTANEGAMKPARRKFLHLEAYAVTSDARLVQAPDTPTFFEHIQKEFHALDARLRDIASEIAEIQPTLYSITSSARSKIDCGTLSPSALAVLRLRTISNFVGI